MQEVSEKAGLSFFGMLTASISHELKNRIAIINEHAGLLDDFVQLQRTGRDFDPERIARLAGGLKNQVSLADNILKSMNLLAHSVDTLCGSVKLDALLRVTADLTHRLVQRRNAQLEVITPDDPVTVATSSFLLMNLLWLCLDSAMPADGESRKIRLSCERQGNEGVIHISMDGPAPQDTSPFPGELVQSVADAIEASLETESKGTGMVVRIPMQPGTSGGNPACTI